MGTIFNLILGHGLAKGIFNIVLFALLDANHQFMFVEVGHQHDVDESKVTIDFEVVFTI